MDDLPRSAHDLIRLARPLDDCRDANASRRVREGVSKTLAAAALGSTVAELPSATRSAKVVGGLKGKLAVVTTVLALAGAGIALRPSSRAVQRSPQRATTAESPPSTPPDVRVAPSAPAPSLERPHEPARSSAAAAPAKHLRRTPAVAAESIAAEVALLGRVSDATARGDVRRATRLLGQHQARFPRPALLAEREGFDTLVACMQHSPDAVAAAQRYRARHPHAVLTGRVARECGLEDDDR